MRKKILAIVFAAALALAVPVFGGVGTASAFDPPDGTGVRQDRPIHPGCPSGASTEPGRGADPPSVPGGHGPGDDLSAHGVKITGPLGSRTTVDCDGNPI